MRRLTERQRRFLWEAMGGVEPWDCEAILRDPDLRTLTSHGLVVRATGTDEDGDEIWWWQTTPAGRAALAPNTTGGTDRG